MREHLAVKIYGKVQGVFFRHSTREKALELALFGFVRNEPDGTVYAEAEGEAEDLKLFLEWCRRGPQAAKVEKVEFDLGKELKKFNRFIIS